MESVLLHQQQLWIVAILAVLVLVVGYTLYYKYIYYPKKAREIKIANMMYDITMNYTQPHHWSEEIFANLCKFILDNDVEENHELHIFYRKKLAWWKQYNDKMQEASENRRKELEAYEERRLDEIYEMTHMAMETEFYDDEMLEILENFIKSHRVTEEDELYDLYLRRLAKRKLEKEKEATDAGGQADEDLALKILMAIKSDGDERP